MDVSLFVLLASVLETEVARGMMVRILFDVDIVFCIIFVAYGIISCNFCGIYLIWIFRERFEVTGLPGVYLQVI